MADDRELGIAELVDGRLVADRPPIQAVIDGKIFGLDMSGPQAAEYFASWSNGYIGSALITGPADASNGHDALTTRPTTTVGIDLAAAPLGTAIVAVEWTETIADARLVSHAADRSEDTDTILTTLTAGDRIGIDCPVGWPERVIDALNAHRSGEPWPTGPSVGHRRSLRLRATDRHIEDYYGMHPLSVSSDVIGSAAMQWASLLTRHERSHGPTDRSGAGRLVEVYPASVERRGPPPGRRSWRNGGAGPRPGARTPCSRHLRLTSRWAPET